MEFAQKYYKIIIAALDSDRRAVIEKLIAMGFSINDYFIRLHHIDRNDGEITIKPLRKINKFCKKNNVNYDNLLTPLYYAIKTNNLTTIMVLIANGALFDTPQHHKINLTEKIIIYSTIPIMEYFISEWKDILIEKINDMHLIEGIICRNKKCDNIGNFCELLIANGVKINISLLAIIALYWRRRPLFEWCMANGADDSYVDKRYGNVYLQLVISNGIDDFDVSDLIEIYKQKYGEIKNTLIGDTDPVNFCIHSYYINSHEYIENLVEKFECPVNKPHPITNEIPCVWLAKHASSTNSRLWRLFITQDTINALSREGHSIYYIALHSENLEKYNNLFCILRDDKFCDKVKAIKYNCENATNYDITNYEFTEKMISHWGSLRFYSPNYLIKYLKTNEIDDHSSSIYANQYNSKSVNENNETIIEIIIKTHKNPKYIIKPIIKKHILSDKDVDIILAWDYEIYYEYIKNKLNYEYKHVNGDSIVTTLIKTFADRPMAIYDMINEIIVANAIIHDIDNDVLKNYNNKLFALYKNRHAILDPQELQNSLQSIECPFCRQNTTIHSHQEEPYTCLICYDEQTISITLACNGKHGHMCMKCTRYNKTTRIREI